MKTAKTGTDSLLGIAIALLTLASGLVLIKRRKDNNI
ncbi:LPXTG cell wall anchor domain-containing protein [Fastidiosipila sanguinis]|uniref:Gram-positive cocci surface proteins LPxTG domain-containing protein n=1 Tax=Fastidiosipila sanguinis TaxID=236753 RepID=A0A2S0KME8_9FIRM|nr:LPXTG cell wall anchor domain-containing protein [Fastidiosipila sanguinis]AVM42210.1 hypothetical protein C5Q98_02715 [Fastidiosipila sanguinis]